MLPAGHLDVIAGPMVFFESEQSKNRAGGMVPLYAARVQDLGPDDVAVFKCGACGHTAELPPSALLRGLGLQPTDKVLDLEQRLRCRLCYACAMRRTRPWCRSGGRRRADPSRQGHA